MRWRHIDAPWLAMEFPSAVCQLDIINKLLIAGIMLRRTTAPFSDLDHGFDCRVWQLSRTWRIVPRVTVTVKGGAELPQVFLERFFEFDALLVAGRFGVALAFNFALHGSFL